MYSEDDDGPSTQGQLSAYEVRAVNGATAAIPSPANGVQRTARARSLGAPERLELHLLGYQFGPRRHRGTLSRPYICGAVPSLPAGFSPAQNTLADSLLAASLADPPSARRVAVGWRRRLRPGASVLHSHLNLDYKFGESGFTVSSLTAINAEYWSEVDDLDNYDSTPLAIRRTRAIRIRPVARFWDFVYGVERETHDFSQELRVSYDQERPVQGRVRRQLPRRPLVWNDLVAITNEIVSGTPRVPQVGQEHRRDAGRVLRRDLRVHRHVPRQRRGPLPGRRRDRLHVAPRRWA